jgi:hypothetical protein
VDGETELQGKIESYCEVMAAGDIPRDVYFPSSIGEIVFNN